MVEKAPDQESAKNQAVPEQVLAEARRLVDLRFLNCFWFWHSDAAVETWDDITLVIKHLREYGGHDEWAEAQNLWKQVQACL